MKQSIYFCQPPEISISLQPSPHVQGAARPHSDCDRKAVTHPVPLKSWWQRHAVTQPCTCFHAFCSNKTILDLPADTQWGHLLRARLFQRGSSGWRSSPRQGRSWCQPDCWPQLQSFTHTPCSARWGPEGMPAIPGCLWPPRFRTGGLL